LFVNDLRGTVLGVPPDDFSPIGRYVGRTHKMLRQWGDRLLEPLDATVTDWIVLFHIEGAEPPGLSQIEIARFADMGGPALVRHLDRLEREGILVRQRDINDRRIVRVNLTDRGRERLDEIGVVMEQCDKQLRALLTPAEERAIERGLDKLFDFALGELARAPEHPHPPTQEDRR
jgi:DNA-binding MarR family transcriptional regulator